MIKTSGTSQGNNLKSSLCATRRNRTFSNLSRYATAVAVGLTCLVPIGCATPTDNGASMPATTKQSTTAVAWPSIQSEVTRDSSIEKRVNAILAGMSLEEKVGQMTQAEIGNVTADDVRVYHLGSVLNGGGSFPSKNKQSTIDDWVALADSFYLASMDTSDGKQAIPVIWGTDAVHGHNNVIGATLFPHNIGLGAADNPGLIEAIGVATAREVAVTGIDWIFAPTLAVARDDRWGRTYESFSEHPRIVREYAERIVHGLQGRKADGTLFGDGRVVTTAKHFLGDGGTQRGVDQGDNIASEQQLLDIHAQGYVTALAAGAQSVMATFNSWNGEKVHGVKYLLNDVLKEKMGFDGFVVSDWNGHGQVKGCTNSACAQSVNAGVDMMMVPEDWKAFITNTIAQVESGEISLARIDDAVRRILRVKIRAGMFEAPKPSARPYAGKKEVVGNAAHRSLARQAVRESLVLLKNNQQVLPIAATSNILVAGSAANDIGQQSGGWTITWQGTDNENSDFPGATSIFAGIQAAANAAGGSATLSTDGRYSQKPDVAVVVFGETPYAEGQGDIEGIDFSSKASDSLRIMQGLQADGIPVVAVFVTGRALWVNPHINASDAFVVAWLPGTEGAGVADLLLAGDAPHDFKGRLSFSWPKMASQEVLNIGDANYAPAFPVGYGLTLASSKTVNALPVDKMKPAVTVADQGAIFSARPVEPYRMYIGDSGGWQVLVTGAETTSHGGSISVSTADYKVQEDARQITWKEAGQTGQVYLQARDPSDFSAHIDAASALQFQMRVDQPPQQKVIMRMDCKHPCRGSQDVTDVFRAVPAKQWATLSIDLACFAQNGADMSKIDTPFLLITDGQFQMTLADLDIVPNAAKSATVSCSN